MQSITFGRLGLFAPATPGNTTLREGVDGLLSLRLRNIIGELADALPPARRHELSSLVSEARWNELTLVLIGYRAPAHESSLKTMDYSRASMTERWTAGREDMSAALDRLEAAGAPDGDCGFRFLDGRRSLG